MLFNPDSNEFNFSVDNFGASYLDANIGVNCVAAGSAFVKGADTNLLNGLAEDCFGLAIMFGGGNESGIIRRAMSDILIDPNAGVGNAGTSWSVLIPSLMSNSSGFGTGRLGYNYYFPIYLRAGTAIGGNHAAMQPGRSLRTVVRAFGKPTRPELMRYGSKVTAYGAVPASVSGQAVTPGTAVLGSYSSGIAITEDAWWWQLGIGSNDTTMADNTYLFDVAIGDATNKRIAMNAMPYLVHGTAEIASKAATGSHNPVLSGKAGENIYVRGAGTIAPETTMTFIAYGLR